MQCDIFYKKYQIKFVKFCQNTMVNLPSLGIPSCLTVPLPFVTFFANTREICLSPRIDYYKNSNNNNNNVYYVDRFPSGSVRGIRGRPRLFWVP